MFWAQSTRVLLTPVYFLFDLIIIYVASILKMLYKFNHTLSFVKWQKACLGISYFEGWNVDGHNEVINFVKNFAICSTTSLSVYANVSLFASNFILHQSI